jgi:hypothetical protein
MGTTTRTGSFLKTTGHRFLVSPDGMNADWIHPLELVSRPGWTDCTDMSDEDFQNLVAERQAVRPYIVGIGA